MKIHGFYSDPHFGHSNIIEYCNRPFENVEHMNTALVHNYNMRVGPDDVVVWLGDCFFKGNDELYSNLLAEMAGTKILIAGNHDRAPETMARLGFAMVFTEAVMHIGGRTCRLCHFPYSASGPEKPDKFAQRRPRRRDTGEILLHGHSHSKIPVRGDCIDLGVDAWKYCPVMYHEVEALVRGLP
jgi:calcineurin-like phosphoesterase family protein